jgi:hypothetical protein
MAEITSAVDPKSMKGAFHWIMLGIGAILVALVVAQFFPQIIPARATTVRL